MSKLIRHFSSGQTWFVTVITAKRLPVLLNNSDLLLRALIRTERKVSFTILAWVILPDHIHALISSDAAVIPNIVHRMKHSFTCQFKKRHRSKAPVWQNRYWDHMIRSDKDLKNHIDYIHYNPVRHGFAESPQQWRLSTFGRYLKQGYYFPDWGQPTKSRLRVL
ncbi:MAG: transposase [Candidatus Zixiibacteriota bacterium]